MELHWLQHHGRINPPVQCHYSIFWSEGGIKNYIGMSRRFISGSTSWHITPTRLNPLYIFLQDFYLHLGRNSEVRYCHATTQDSLNCTLETAHKPQYIQLNFNIFSLLLRTIYNPYTNNLAVATVCNSKPTAHNLFCHSTLALLYTTLYNHQSCYTLHTGHHKHRSMH